MIEYLSNTRHFRTTMSAAALALLLSAAPATAATLTVTTPLIPNWFDERDDSSLQGTPVTLEIDFDESVTGNHVDGTGWVTLAGVRQQGVSARITFTTISASGSANGNIMSVSVVLDDQPYVRNDFFVPGRGWVTTFTDVNPDEFPIRNVDLNRFDINLYGPTPANLDTTPIGESIAGFIATPREAGQRVVYWPSSFQSMLWGPQSGVFATAGLSTSGGGTGSGGPSPSPVPLPAAGLLLLGALSGFGLAARRRRDA